jgi:hypothetical protein
MNESNTKAKPERKAPIAGEISGIADRTCSWFDKPTSRLGHVMLMALILSAPWWLFGLGRLPAWIAPESRISTYVHQNLSYRLYSDDFAYVGASRNWSRTVDNLFMPHNTHICPSWRLLTWGVVQAAGDLVRLPEVMKLVSYLALVLVMLATGHFVAQESKSLTLGFAASALVGVTSIQRLSTIWFSAGQTLWAGLFILSSLILAQEALRRRWYWLWPGVFLACWIAGGFWTIGHAAGPVTAVYVLAAARGRSRAFAILPATAMISAVAIALTFGGQEIDASISFHGRSSREAFNAVQGLSHTCHSIVETLILANLGIDALTTDVQAVTLTLMLMAVWAGWHVRNARSVTNLEWTGAALCISAYWVEWSFRGYFSWEMLKGILHWYDSIPQIGWAIFLAGWIHAAVGEKSEWTAGPSRPARIIRRNALIILAFCLSMLALHQSEVDKQLIASMPPITPREAASNAFPIPELKKLRAVFLWDERAKRITRHLVRLQNAESIAQKSGWSVADISAAFGRVRIPAIPKVYDGVYFMNLPLVSAQPANPSVVRQALSRLLEIEPETRPPWLNNISDPWPPPGWGDSEDDKPEPKRSEP